MATGTSLGLALPQQNTPDKESFDIRTGPLAEWISQLPTGNIGETTKQLYRAMHDVNRHRHGWKQRFRFMESIREPLDNVQRSISKRYSGLSFPLPAKTQQIATLAQRLHTETAIGYMAAIEEMLDALFVFQDRQALKVMVHRAVRHLSQSLLTAYQVYSQEQAGCWHQLHALYAFAEAQGFHQDPVRDPLADDQGESSVARLYKQIVLLATASPYRLRQGEAAATYQALARWAAHAKLLEVKEADAAAALFTLHLDSDEEPEYRNLDHLPCDGTACRLIDTRQMVRVIQEEAGQASLLPTELYQPLIQCWQAAPVRVERRNEGGDTIEVVIGMIQIHHLLCPGLQAEVPGLQKPPFESASSTGYSRQLNERARSAGGDIWNTYSTREPQPADTPNQPPRETASNATIQHWTVINESVGGFRLAVPEGQEAGLRVGEILAVQEAHSRGRWHLTVVRWIRQYEQGDFEAGVQIIASEVVPVLVKSLSPGRDKGEFQRGLLLPEAPERGLPATVFVANRLFTPSEKVLLHVSGHQIEIVLGNAIQNCGSFVQFGFHAGEAAGGGGSPFEKVWEQL